MMSSVLTTSLVIKQQKTTTYSGKCFNIAIRPPLLSTHDCVQAYLVLLQTVTGLAVYTCGSSPEPYYANS